MLFNFHPVWGWWMCILNCKFESPCRVHWFDLKPAPLTSRRSHPRALAFWHVLGIHINPGFSLLDPMAEHISGHEVALIQYKNVQNKIVKYCEVHLRLCCICRSWVKFLHADFMTERKTTDSPLKPQLIFMSRKTARAMLPTKHSIATRVDRRVPAALPRISHNFTWSQSHSLDTWTWILAILALHEVSVEIHWNTDSYMSNEADSSKNISTICLDSS